MINNSKTLNAVFNALLVFLILGKAWMGRAMKKVIVQGG